MKRLLLVFAALLAVGDANPRATSAVQYRFTFPEPQHHWMQVEAWFRDLEPRPLELRISRSSPGRYALHDFAKNVYDVHAFAEDGRELAAVRPDASGWTVADHPSSVRVAYKVFGDRVDGTYLAIDDTHAHMNMPAVIMWARGLDDRPVSVVLTQPPGERWQAATQLHSPPAGSQSLEFTAANLQYLMDSPIEFGPIEVRRFSVGDRSFRFAVHEADRVEGLDAFVGDVERIVSEEGKIFGEYPLYEPGSYTFLADYLPYADGDGMEHRNSTVMTSTGSLATSRSDLLETVAHEFFHNWNVERIRPRSLEPFDFDRANMSGELWLAEGFTQYYGPLALRRAGLLDLTAVSETLADLVNSVTLSPARLIRSAEEMSRMAPFVDGARPIDRTNWSNTVLSYYSYGGAIALALDLTLRERSNGQVSLDDYMRAMWRVHGKPGGALEGYVDRPYTMEDAEARLAEVSGDRAFARDFFSRYIQGHALPDYGPLLVRAGLVLRKRNPGRAWWGDARFDTQGGGLRLLTAPELESPLYKAGLDVGDMIGQIDGVRVSSSEDLNAVVRRHRPGETVVATFSRRSGLTGKASVVLAEDQRLEIVPMETIGSPLTADQKTFRDRWFGRN